MIVPLPKQLKEQFKRWLCRRWEVPYCPEEIPFGLYRRIESSPPLRVVDVGAHRGGFMKSISRICGVSRGVLVEALPFKIEWLKRDFASSEYRIFECAVTDRTGTVQFNLNPMSDTSSILRLRQEMPELSALPEGSPEPLTVACRKLDDLVSESNLDHIDLLKIDVQGAEATVFAGATQTLAKTSLILTEVSLKPLYDDSATFFDIYRIMTGAGFKLLDLNPEFRAPDGELLQCDALFSTRMTARSRLKYWFHQNIPGLSGRFRYFGVQVHFPRGSVIFRMICEQGVYERDNARLLATLAGRKEGGLIFDVGANIGSMAIPVLDAQPTCKVLSFEPSPETSRCLQRTIAGSRFRDRWQLVEKAVGEAEGVFEFFAADSGMDAYNGFVNTRRSGQARRLEVSVTTLDLCWKELGCPSVSAVKIDVEGAELRVLEGAREMIAAEQPAILLEWNVLNLRAYDKKPGHLLEQSESLSYRVFSVPNLVPVESADDLQIQMLQTESFLLVPASGLGKGASA